MTTCSMMVNLLVHHSERILSFINEQFEQHNEVQFVNNLIHFSVTQCLILIHMRSEQV